MKWITREHVKVDRVTCPWLYQKVRGPGCRVLLRAARRSDPRVEEVGRDTVWRSGG
jgi:hypothetical protein